MTTATLVGCGDPPPTSRSVVARLLAGPPVGRPGSCETGGESRPALGCPRAILLFDPKPDDTSGLVRFRTAPFWNGRRVVVSVEVGAARDGWTPLASQQAEVQGGSVSVAAPAPGPGALHARAWLLPGKAAPRRSEALRIPRDARLLVGFASSDIVPTQRRARTSFTINALHGGESTVLLDAERGSDDDGAWIDRSLDLSALAGEEVTFELSANPDPESPDRFSIPLWGVPVLTAPSTIPRPRIVLISIDTLRADFLGAYGSRWPTSPHLDEFAEQAALFSDTTAPWPSTTASHMSLLTGVYPNAHRVLAPGAQLPAGIATVTEILARQGYQAMAITEDGMIVGQAGFARGFDTYTEIRDLTRLHTRGYIRDVVDHGIAWIEQHRDDEFFVFLHTYQVHGPYDPPAEYDRFVPAGGGLLARNRAAYAGEILYSDHEIQRLLDALVRLGLDQGTTVIVTSDHGEAFGEHGVIGHNVNLIEECVRVPLLIRAPGRLTAGARVDTPVSLVDVAPTMLALAGIAAPDSMQGRSLMSLATRTPSADEPVGQPYTRNGPGWSRCGRGA